MEGCYLFEFLDYFLVKRVCSFSFYNSKVPIFTRKYFISELFGITKENDIQRSKAHSRSLRCVKFMYNQMAVFDL